MNGLLFITHQTVKYSYLDSVKIALKGGCRQIQLRMKNEPLVEVEKIGLQVRELCLKYNAKLYIDDYVDVCKNINATGVHLGKLDMPPSDARRILGDEAIIGGTANTLEDICRLKIESVNYIGLGPFRFTVTKRNLSPILGLLGYEKIIRQCREKQINLPIVAIGGITVDDIPDLMKIGVSGIALSSSILTSENPIEETKKIINTINQYQL